MERKRLTVSQARKCGWEVARGDRHGTTHKPTDRWYLQKIDAPSCRGGGWRTRREALDFLSDIID